MATFRNHDGAQDIDGTSEDDLFYIALGSAGGGDDVFDGRGGDDTIYGGHGNDTLYGGWHDDTLYWGVDDDTLHATGVERPMPRRRQPSLAYLPICSPAAFALASCFDAFASCCLALALCSAFFGPLVTAACAVSLPSIVFSPTALPLSFTAVVVCAKALPLTMPPVNATAARAARRLSFFMM